MDGRRFALIVGAALFVGFLAVNLVVGSWFKGARLDLTGKQIYSLSPGTRDVLARLGEPIDLTLYFSQSQASQAPELQIYGVRVREMLQSYVAASNGRIRLKVIDPEPFTDAETEAQAAGVQPLRSRASNELLYLGLVGRNAVREQVVLPILRPAQEPSLEYDLTRLIAQLDQPLGYKVALITSLRIDPEGAAAALGQGPQNQAFGVFAGQLGQEAEVTALPRDFTAVPAEADILAIIHPWELTPAQLYAVDQYVMAKGRAFIALDPLSLAAFEEQRMGLGAPGAAPAPLASTLAPILSAWGVSVSADAVVDIAYADRDVDPGGLPQLYIVPASQFERADLLTSLFNRGVRFGVAGAITTTPVNGIIATPLIRSSERTSRWPANEQLLMTDTAQLLRGGTPGAEPATLALSVAGDLRSAFAVGPPAGAAPTGPHLAQGAVPGRVVVVSDTDFLTTALTQLRDGALLDNIAFGVNALDILRGDEALVSLRARAPALNRLTALDEIRNTAAQRTAAEVARLEAEVQATRQRLQQLEASGGAGALFGAADAQVDQAQQEEFARYQQLEKRAITRLRNIQRAADEELGGLRGLLMFVHVWLGPLLVAGAGLVLFWRRGRRGAGGANEPKAAGTAP